MEQEPVTLRVDTYTSIIKNYEFKNEVVIDHCFKKYVSASKDYVI